MARFVDASGFAVAKVSSANCSGVDDELAKLMSEKETPFDDTSGTLPIVLPVPQVIPPWIAAATSAVSAGRVSLPTMKQAACRLASGVGAAWRVMLVKKKAFWDFNIVRESAVLLTESRSHHGCQDSYAQNVKPLKTHLEGF